MKSFIFFSFLLAAHSTQFTEAEREFLDFIVRYKRSYGTKEEYEFRFSIFKHEYEEIKRINAEQSKFTVAVNQFSDLTEAEFSQRLGYTPTSETFVVDEEQAHIAPTVNPDDYLDWVEQGAVSYVKDQGSCGSCWSFSTTGSLEGEHFLSQGAMEVLSEQQFIDCDELNNGCSGGQMYKAFQYAIDNYIVRESEYPYEAEDAEECRAEGKEQIFTIAGYRNVTKESEQAMLEALKKRPVSVAVQGSSSVFKSYSSGVLDSDECGENLSHAVLAVGYGVEDDTPYYKVKNSWGTAWGDEGYIKIARNGDGPGICGIQKAGSFPYA